MPSINIGDLVKPPVQTEAMTEDFRGVPVARRTWYRFFLELFYRGFWNDIAYKAGDFTASGTMTWTVEQGDVMSNAFTQVGKTLFVAWDITTASIAAPLSNELRIAIPRKHTAARDMCNAVRIQDNGAFGLGVASVDVGQSYIAIRKGDESNFSVSANNAGACGMIVIQVEG